MNTTQHITREALDKANFTATNYSPNIFALSRRLEAMFPEEPNGIIVVEAKIAIPKLTLGEIAKLMDTQVEVTTLEFEGASMTEHSLQILCGDTLVEVYCIAG